MELLWSTTAPQRSGSTIAPQSESMQQVKFKNHLWLNFTHPTEEDVSMLKKRYKFHELDLEDCLSETQRPKIDEYEKYLFIVLEFPYYHKKLHRLETEQVNIFIGQNYLITLHNGELEGLNEIFEACQKSLKSRRTFFGSSIGYLLYEIISALFEDIFPIADQNQLALKRIETQIFEHLQPKDQLHKIMLVKKNIITLRKIILPQRSVIAALEHKQKRFLPENLIIYFDDIVDQIEKLWSILETQKEVIESLEDTHESLLSHNINLTMRTLTVFSAIMLPLTFLTGLFGMNVKLPFFQALENIEHFWNIVIVMIATAIILFGIFKWKKWL